MKRSPALESAVDSDAAGGTGMGAGIGGGGGLGGTIGGDCASVMPRTTAVASTEANIRPWFRNDRAMSTLLSSRSSIAREPMTLTGYDASARGLACPISLIGRATLRMNPFLR